MSYDVYLAHASENAAGSRRLAEALQGRGLLVWFNSFIVGPSIREQMEQGLRDSDFGVVVLSPEFFAKKWTRQELDALFALEEPGEVRILPVWWGTSEDDVRSHSPMLAMRSAAVLHDDDVEAVAEALMESIVTLSGRSSAGKRLRLRIATGFPWPHPPVFMPKSLAEYDRANAEDYAITELAYYPDMPHRPGGESVPLVDLLRAHGLWDGRRVTVIGRQVSGTVQVFEELVPPDQVPDDIDLPPGTGIAAYVFQMSSVDFDAGELCYVYGVGPYSRAESGMGPNAPDDDSLCWVTGLLMTYGVMKNRRGDLVDSIYLAASWILFTPKVDGVAEESDSS
jgi:hypothetical protein